MNIKVLGSGCSRCKQLEQHTKEAVTGLGIDAEIQKIEDFRTIMAYGVMQTPALVIDEKLVLSGRVPSIPEIMVLIQNTQIPN
jgi:small redox-active disulfide protein 2